MTDMNKGRLLILNALAGMMIVMLIEGCATDRPDSWRYIVPMDAEWIEKTFFPHMPYPLDEAKRFGVRGDRCYYESGSVKANQSCVKWMVGQFEEGGR